MPVSRNQQTSLESVELSLTTKIDVDGVRKLLEESREFFIGTELKESQNLSFENFRFQVKNLVPDEGVVTGNTEILLSFTPRKLPHCYIIAIDTSYSMNKRDLKPTRYGATLSALEAFLQKKTGSGESIGIVEYGMDWDVTREPEPLKKNDAAVARKQLEEKKPRGKASLGDAVAALCEVYEVLDQEDALRIGVIVTDGVDDGLTRLSRSLEKAKSDNIVINTIFIGDEQDTDSTEVARNIALFTGGIFVRPENAKDLDKAFTSFSSKTTLNMMSKDSFPSPGSSIPDSSPGADPGEDEKVVDTGDVDTGPGSDSTEAGSDTGAEEKDGKKGNEEKDGKKGNEEKNGKKGNEEERKERKESLKKEEKAGPGKVKEKDTGSNKESENDGNPDRNDPSNDETVIRVEGPSPTRLGRRKHSQRTPTFKAALKKLIDKLY